MRHIKTHLMQATILYETHETSLVYLFTSYVLILSFCFIL